MEYRCVDLGSEKCPCTLMESGQCYTCNMIKGGKCNCSSLWQGVCPYTEYIQSGKKAKKNSLLKNFNIFKIKSYSPTLTVITLEVPIAYGIKCKDIGAFLMLKWQNWFIPISVLQVALDYEEQLGYIDIAINATGPKTIGLLKASVIGQDVTVKGPFYSGLLRKRKIDFKGQTIIVAKGIALMPLINIKDALRKNIIYFGLDTSKLPKEFLNKYLGDLEFEEIDIEKDIYDISETVKEKYGYSLASCDISPNLFFMTSPYYVGQLLNLTSFDESKVIRPNHSNMCCGEGICGSCSHTDKDGIVIKTCKCTD